MADVRGGVRLRTPVQEIMDAKSIVLRGIVAIYPANSVGDDIEVYTDEDRQSVAATFHGLRQQVRAINTSSASCVTCLLSPSVSGLARRTADCRVTGPCAHQRCGAAGLIVISAATFQAEKDTEEPYYCISDFIAPKVRPLAPWYVFHGRAEGGGQRMHV